MRRVSPSETPFYKRNAPYMLGIEANWEKKEESDANIAWARNVFEDMHRFSEGGSYLNFPGFVEQREDLLKGAYGPNLKGLQEIKARYDPENLFHGTINIAS